MGAGKLTCCDLIRCAGADVATQRCASRATRDKWSVTVSRPHLRGVGSAGHFVSARARAVWGACLHSAEQARFGGSLRGYALVLSLLF